MDAMKTCPNCHKPLAPNAPDGLCPECLVKAGVPTGEDIAGPTAQSGETAGPHGTKILKPPPSLEEIARHFPQFQILECLGRGGMGVVYKARQPKLNRLVALKILAPEKVAETRFAERFEREAQALARLNHQNIVTVHDFGEANGLYYLLMEYVDGVSLRQLLQTRKIAPEEALTIVPKICEALQFAHEQGVVHRDIKPENVLLDKQGRVKIADFGIAKIVGETGGAGSPLPAEATEVAGGAQGTARPGTSLTQDQVLGTPNYMAPEQVAKPQLVDHRADIYSLGVVFYEMLTGELPLGKFQPPSKKVQVDVRLDEIVLRALERNPELRYQQASVLKTQVETIAHTLPLPAVVSPQPAKINWMPALAANGLSAALWVTMLEADVGHPGFSDSVLVGLLIGAVAVTYVVLCARLHYRCWKALPEQFRATTPGKAVGLLFVPIYNFYWAFISFPKLADGYNAIRAEHPELPLLNMRKFGLAFAVSFVAGWVLCWVPYGGSCLAILDLILFIFFYRGIVHNANLLIGQTQSSGRFRQSAQGQAGVGAFSSSQAAQEMDDQALVRTRLEVKGPATALFILGCLNFGVVFSVLAYNYSMARQQHGQVGGSELMLLPLAGYAVTVIGAAQMRRLASYGLAIAATICAMILPLGCIVGFPLGIWSLFVLTRREVREAFQASRDGQRARTVTPTQPTPAVDEGALARAREEVKAPASWLVTTGVLNTIAIPLMTAAVAVTVRPEQFSVYRSLIWLAAVFLSGTIILAGVKMKRLEAYGLAVLGSLLAIVIVPGNIIGLPVGIWSLVALLRRDVREAFKGSVRVLPEPHLSRAAIVGTVWAMAGLMLAAIAASLGATLNPAGHPPGPAPLGAILMAAVCLTAPFGTTILGWIALAQIRRSAGKLYGVRLAMFNGLLFPLLVLVAVLWFAWYGMLDWGFPLLQKLGVRQPSLAFSVILWLPWLAGSVVLCVWVAKRAQRAIDRVSGLAVESPAPAPERFLWRFAAATVVVLLCLTAFVLWAQRPRLIGETYFSDSPDGRYSAMAQTFHEMRVLGDDKTYYRFTVQGMGGTMFARWKIPVPMAKLATNYAPMPLNQVVFDVTNRASIHWSKDSQRVSFLVRDVEVFSYDVATGSGTSASSPPEGFYASFGPVVERQFTNSVIMDLDSGKTGTELPESVTMPDSIIENVFSAFDWMNQKGFDLAWFQEDGPFGVGMKVTNLGLEDWENLSPAQLVAGLDGISETVSKKFRHATYGFETREGTTGLLQISGLSNGLPGIRLHYKLVQSPRLPK